MAKYPTPEEAVRNFTEAVSSEDTQKKWGTHAARGAEKLGNYFKRAFPAVYSVIASDDFQKETDPWERSKKVGTKISEVALDYRKEKLRALVEAVKPAA